MNTIIIQPDTKEKIETAFQLMSAYITYVQEMHPGIHWAADGTPSCQAALATATNAFHYDTE
jgi:hypothetical protein